MSQRALYLDRSPGELRGVVSLNGEPERLIVERDGDDERLRLGARVAARVSSVETVLSMAFLDLGGGAEAALAFRPGSQPGRGQMLEVEIRTEPQGGKLALARAIGAGSGAPRVLTPAPPLAERLLAFARDAEILVGRAARQMADEAEAQALASIHPIPEGGDVAIEPTRALVAVDVDLGARKGVEAKRAARQVNLAAIGQIARLLRLKALGGLVVIDLVGRGHDGAALLAAARGAFAPDNPGVAIGPVNRFGLMELALPKRQRPVAEALCDSAGGLSLRSQAQRLVRRLQGEAEAQPGARLTARCSPDVAERAEPLVAALRSQYGARLSLRPQADWPRDRLDVGAE